MAWQWVPIYWNSVVTTVTDARMPARGMAADVAVHVPGTRTATFSDAVYQQY